MYPLITLDVFVLVAETNIWGCPRTNHEIGQEGPHTLTDWWVSHYPHSMDHRLVSFSLSSLHGSQIGEFLIILTPWITDWWVSHYPHSMDHRLASFSLSSLHGSQIGEFLIILTPWITDWWVSHFTPWIKDWWVPHYPHSTYCLYHRLVSLSTNQINYYL